MAKYYTCPYCGANLDFGEKCECEEIKTIWTPSAEDEKSIRKEKTA